VIEKCVKGLHLDNSSWKKKKKLMKSKRRLTGQVAQILNCKEMKFACEENRNKRRQWTNPCSEGMSFFQSYKIMHNHSREDWFTQHRSHTHNITKLENHGERQRESLRNKARKRWNAHQLFEKSTVLLFYLSFFSLV
jgi:hypothetical protein